MFPASLHHILVPVDFSSFSDRALDTAIRMAQPNSARLTLLHALMPADSDEEVGHLPAELVAMIKERAQKRLDACVARATERGVSCASEVRFGLIDQSILAAVDQLKPDLLVMGSHGRTGLERVMLGSVTERVLPRAGCPVLVVPGSPA